MEKTRNPLYDAQLTVIFSNKSVHIFFEMLLTEIHFNNIILIRDA